MRFGIGGERFRLRAGPVAMTFGTVSAPVGQMVLLTIGPKVLTFSGLALGVEAIDE